MLHLEITEVALVHCNIVNRDFQQDSRFIVYIYSNTFVQLLDISPKNFLLQTIGLQLSSTEVWFTDQNSKLPDMEDKRKITLVIN